MSNKDIVKDWLQLDRDLVEDVVITIDEKIRQAEVALFNLRARKAKGESDTISHPGMINIEGIAIKHQSKSKIALSTSRAKNRKKYDIEMKIVKKWLKENGYKWVDSCRTMNTNTGGCDKKKAGWLRIK